MKSVTFNEDKVDIAYNEQLTSKKLIENKGRYHTLSPSLKKFLDVGLLSDHSTSNPHRSKSQEIKEIELKSSKENLPTQVKGYGILKSSKAPENPSQKTVKSISKSDESNSARTRKRSATIGTTVHQILTNGNRFKKESSASGGYTSEREKNTKSQGITSNDDVNEIRSLRNPINVSRTQVRRSRKRPNSKKKSRRSRYADLEDDRPLSYNVAAAENEQEQEELNNKRFIPPPKHYTLAPDHGFNVHSRILEREKPLKMISSFEHSPSLRKKRQNEHIVNNPRLKYKNSLTPLLEPGYEMLDDLKEKFREEQKANKDLLEELLEEKKRRKNTNLLFPAPHLYQHPEIHANTSHSLTSLQSKQNRSNLLEESVEETDDYNEDELLREKLLMNRIKMYDELIEQFSTDNDMEGKDGGLISVKNRRGSKSISNKDNARNENEEEKSRGIKSTDLSIPIGLSMETQSLIARMYANPPEAQVIADKEFNKREKIYREKRDRMRKQADAILQKEYLMVEKSLLKHRFPHLMKYQETITSHS